MLKDSDGRTVTDDIEKATLLNDYFTQCFNSAVPRLDESVFEYYRLDPLCCPDDLLCSEEEVIDLYCLLTHQKLTVQMGSLLQC